MPTGKYPIIEEAARHCWSNRFLDKFRDFYAEHASVFADAPEKISGEQNLEYYSLFQQYLTMYESGLSRYIQSLDISETEFYRELGAVRDDPDVKDKKLLYFVDYLIACTDYASFYKVMIRAAKKQRKSALESKAEGKTELDLFDSPVAESKYSGSSSSGAKGCK